MAYNPKNLKRAFDSPLTARDVARRIAPSLDSDEIARTAQRVKHYARNKLIFALEGENEGPGRYRRYNEQSAYHAALVQEMSLSGCNVEKIRNAMVVMQERRDLSSLSPLMVALGREVERIHINTEFSMPTVFLVVNCSDGEAWAGSDLTQAPIGLSHFVFNVAAIFEKVRA